GVPPDPGARRDKGTAAPVPAAALPLQPGGRPAAAAAGLRRRRPAGGGAADGSRPRGRARRPRLGPGCGPPVGAAPSLPRAPFSVPVWGDGESAQRLPVRYSSDRPSEYNGWFKVTRTCRQGGLVCRLSAELDRALCRRIATPLTLFRGRVHT